MRSLWHKDDQGSEYNPSYDEAQRLHDSRVMLSVQLEAKEDGLVALVDANLTFKINSYLSLYIHPQDKKFLFSGHRSASFRFFIRHHATLLSHVSSVCLEDLFASFVQFNSLAHLLI